jgi:hypothetical protein
LSGTWSCSSERCVIPAALTGWRSPSPGEERSGGSRTSWHAGPDSSTGGMRSPRSVSVAGHGPGSPTPATTSARGRRLHDPASRMSLRGGVSAPAGMLTREILSPGSSQGGPLRGEGEPEPTAEEGQRTSAAPRNAGGWPGWPPPTGCAGIRCSPVKRIPDEARMVTRSAERSVTAGTRGGRGWRGDPRCVPRRSAHLRHIPRVASHRAGPGVDACRQPGDRRLPPFLGDRRLAAWLAACRAG